MSDRTYVLTAGAALVYFAFLVLAFALARSAAIADAIREQENRERPEPADLMAVYEAVHREAEQITREAVMRDNS